MERLYKCRLCHRAKHLRGVVCPIKQLSVSAAPHLGEAAAAAAELTSDEALRRVLLDGVPFLRPQPLRSPASSQCNCSPLRSSRPEACNRRSRSEKSCLEQTWHMS